MDQGTAGSAPAQAFGARLNALRVLLAELYEDDAATELLRSVLDLLDAPPLERRAEAPRAPAPGHWSEADVVLITYGGTFRRDGELPLVSLAAFCDAHLDGLVSCVHVLPFFPWSSDDGFAVVDFLAVDPALGDWEQVSALGHRYALMADLVINHVSRESLWFIDFVAGRPPGRDYFLTLPEDTDTSAVVRPRTTPLLVPVHTYRGLRHVWATFSEDQIDLDFRNPRVLLEMIRVLLHLLRHGVRVIRLDAIAFLWKELGTSCVHHPHTHRVVRALRIICELACDPRSDPVSLITETNVPHEENVSYFGDGDEAHLVYQFPLAPLMLHAFVAGRASTLVDWLAALDAPPEGCTFLNFTASHDGIGLRPVEGLLEDVQVDALVEHVHGLGGFVSMRSTAGGGERPYEINCTWFDALGGTLEGGPDDAAAARVLASQLLMLSLQGVPAFYVHALLASRNDLAGVERTGRTRSINRAVLDLDELDAELADPGSERARVFGALRRALEVRRRLPAFSPDAAQRVHPLSDALVVLERGAGSDRTLVVANVTATARRLDGELRSDLGIATALVDRLAPVTGAASHHGSAGDLSIAPYGCLWLQRID